MITLDKVVYSCDNGCYRQMEHKMKAKKLNKLQKPRNLVAKDLFTPKYRLKVELSTVNSYNRAVEKQNFRKYNVYL